MGLAVELKTCPFCGETAEFYRTPIKTHGSWCDSVVVRCKECGARTARVLYNKNKHGIDGEYDEAAKAWNNREPIKKTVDMLRDYAKYKGILRVSMSAPAENYVPISAVIDIVKNGGSKG